MNHSAASTAASSKSSRIRVDALLSTVEAEALQHVLEKLTLDDYRQFTANDAEAQICINAASKLRRQLEAAEELPVMPDYDD